MRTKLFLLWTFSQRFLPALLVVDAVCAQLVWLYGFSVLKLLLYFKLFSDAVIFYLVHKLRRAEAFYYRNLGLTQTRLWMVALLVDLLLFGASLAFSFHLSSHAGSR